MNTSQQWLQYFKHNSQQHRINWQQQPSITTQELQPVLKSLQAWQLGESSDGKNLMAATTKYAAKISDTTYIETMQLFIKEEQKHGSNLGKYLDAIQQPRITKNWGDSLFRKIRGLNKNIEWWTLAVITVESTAQIFYQCLKDATNCNLLKQICTDILIDEAPHIQFQKERMEIIFNAKPNWQKPFSYWFYKLFFYATSLVVWHAHKKLFKAGGVHFIKYLYKMDNKYRKTLGKLLFSSTEQHRQFKPSITLPKKFNYVN